MQQPVARPEINIPRLFRRLGLLPPLPEGVTEEDVLAAQNQTQIVVPTPIVVVQVPTSIVVELPPIPIEKSSKKLRLRGPAIPLNSKELTTILDKIQIVSEEVLPIQNQTCVESRFYRWNNMDSEMFDVFAENVPKTLAWLTQSMLVLNNRFDGRVDVLVKSKHGRHRSTAVVMAWLMVHRGLLPEHLDWALSEMQKVNSIKGHLQTLSITNFEHVLRSM